jgi:ribosomal protein S9
MRVPAEVEAPPAGTYDLSIHVEGGGVISQPIEIRGVEVLP